LNDPNVRQKQLAILDWIRRINKLKSEDRMGKDWEYILLGQTHFKGLKNNKASIDEVCQLAKVRPENITGKLL
jgi:type III restriction enzyme